MKKKIFCLLLILILPICLMFSGCSDSKEYMPCDNRFICIYKQSDGFLYRIVVDKDTKVMYLFSKTGYGAGLTVMLDSNGKPLIYEGEL